MNDLRQAIWQNRVTLAVVAVVFLPIGFIVWNMAHSRDDTRVNEIRRHGYPATLAELAIWYQPVPEAENAALVYTQAFATLIVSNFPNLGDLSGARKWLPPRGELLNPADRREFGNLLATNRTALGLVRSAAALRSSRYPIDVTRGFNTLLPHLSGLKQAVALLAMDALLQAADGESEKAVQDLLNAGRLADSVAEEPTVVSQLVRFSCWTLLCSSVERIVSATALTEEQLAALQKMIHEAERPRGLTRGLAGERAMGLSVFIDRDQQAALFGFQQNNIVRSASVLLFKASGLYQKDKAFYLDTMATNIMASELPFPERSKAGQRAVAVMSGPPNRFYLISNMTLPALSKMYSRDADHTARIRATQTALAIERFRRAHGEALPDSLADLADFGLAPVPVDPIDGQPLRFKKLEHGYVVYGVGGDGRDDGGTEYDAKNPKRGSDVTFTVAR